MSKKLTISIPDTLHKRLDKYRNRIAISNVCAEALNTEIENIDDCVKEIKRRFRLLTSREISSLAYKEGRQWAGYKATLEELAIVSCWVSADDEEPDWFDFTYNNKDVKSCLNAWSTVQELVMHSFMSEKVKIKSEADDFYFNNFDVASDFISGAREIWWEIENEAIEILTSSKK